MNKWPSFEQLAKMAETHPEALEQFRQREVEALIDSAPVEMQRRLRGLQFQIDCQRQLHPTPVGACLAISKMMHESLGRLQRALHGLQSEAELDSQSPSQAANGAQIIPFPAAG
ncbi:uncharacterized protein DUF3135 [Alteromonadaceae bacterium 2753L.S.0a.02]|nr:uncharacterized protein DUF3135 [Alteromonadaceae bacterium 2753L.S.0a.02]